MALERCPSGHFYDPAKHSQCPYCGVPDLKVDHTAPHHRAAPAPVPAPAAAPAPAPARAEGVTLPLGRQKSGIDPVVGWLVCIDGPDRGRDYRLHSERNHLGRSEKMDICVSGDLTISRDSHAVIVFDPATCRFELIAGSARGIVRCNNEAVHTMRTLERGDILQVGETRLLFVPLCGEAFRWPAPETPPS
jgi:hypothetical protein